jgi:hypothetical protein
MDMAVRKLVRGDDGSYRVTLPKKELRESGVVPDDGELDEDTFVKIEGDGREFDLSILEL